MGAFGIYALVVTFLFLIYYIVMISLDLSKKTGKKGNSSEVISLASNNTEKSPVEEQPITVEEGADGVYSVHKPGESPESFGVKKEEAAHSLKQESRDFPTEKEENLVSNADEDQSLQEAKAKMQPIEHYYADNEGVIIEGSSDIYAIEDKAKSLLFK